MERESFEDKEIGEILNEHYVAIKVDREERPDIDTVYMSACQALTGQGGWPLTIIMTPAKKPFFAGTYFPKKDTRSMPGLLNILQEVANLWRNEKERLIQSGQSITDALKEHHSSETAGGFSDDSLSKVLPAYLKVFDSDFGGFGQAPKFPTPHNLSLLLRLHETSQDPAALEMVTKTLDSMYCGGIFDHIGGGFARYSVDRQWLAPHFEKMLYDNALLAIAYLEAYQVNGNQLHAEIARRIFCYVLRDMTSPQGGFYSAEDADSEGEEGKFYLWTPTQVAEALGQDLGPRFCADYDITAHGNFHGKSIPNLIKKGPVTGYDEAIKNLYQYRRQRIHPFKDDKILTAWNGLMIAALALGGRVLNEQTYIDAARNAVLFITDKLRRQDGRLMARYRDGEAAYPGTLDDYAFFIWGLIELYLADLNRYYLDLAVELTKDMDVLFWAKTTGGFFLTSHDAENLFFRPKEIYDGALPSGNSVAAVNLIRLARLTDETWLKEKSRLQLDAFSGSVMRSPLGHAHFLMALWLNQAVPLEITVIGNKNSPDTKELLAVIGNNFNPELVLTFKEHDGNSLAQAIVCSNYTCHPKVSTGRELEQLLRR